MLITPYLAGAYEVWRSRTVTNLYFKDLNYQNRGRLQRLLILFKPFELWHKGDMDLKSHYRFSFLESVAPENVQKMPLKDLSIHQLSVLASRKEVVCTLNLDQLKLFSSKLDINILTTLLNASQRLTLVKHWNSTSFKNIQSLEAKHVWLYFMSCENTEAKNQFFNLLTNEQKRTLASSKEVVQELGVNQLDGLFKDLFSNNIGINTLASLMHESQRPGLVERWNSTSFKGVKSLETMHVQWYFMGCRNAYEKNNFFGLLQFQQQIDFHRSINRGT